MLVPSSYSWGEYSCIRYIRQKHKTAFNIIITLHNQNLFLVKGNRKFMKISLFLKSIFLKIVFRLTFIFIKNKFHVCWFHYFANQAKRWWNQTNRVVYTCTLWHLLKLPTTTKGGEKVSPCMYPFCSKYGCCSKISRSPKLLMEPNDKKFKAQLPAARMMPYIYHQSILLGNRSHQSIFGLTRMKKIKDKMKQ